VVRRERRIDGDAEEAALLVVADLGRDVERGRRDQRTVLDHVELAEMARDEDPAVGREGDRRGAADLRDELVLEPVRDDGRLGGRGESRRKYPEQRECSQTRDPSRTTVTSHGPPPKRGRRAYPPRGA